MRHILEVERIGQVIAAERAAAGLKQYKVSALADLDAKRLRAIEKGRIEPSAELAARILRVIRVLAHD